MVQYIDAAEVAKLIRQDLKKAFPKTKFQVQTKKYTGGASVNIYWTDGETSKQVEAIVSKYRGSAFDAMQDLKTSVYQTNSKGEQIRYMSDYVFCNRSISAEQLEKFAAYVVKTHHLTSERFNRVKVENYQYNLSRGYLERPRDYKQNAYFGGELFEDYVSKLAREHESFEAFLAHEAHEEKELQAYIAERKTEQEAQAPKQEVQDDYVACMMAAGWI